MRIPSVESYARERGARVVSGLHLCLGRPERVERRRVREQLRQAVTIRSHPLFLDLPPAEARAKNEMLLPTETHDRDARRRIGE